MKAILGIKKGMTRVFEGDSSIPVTVVDVSTCVVANITKDGIELGVGKSTNPDKPMTGKYGKLGFVPSYRKVFTVLDGDLKVGDSISGDFFKAGELVVVTGEAKGKGFAGVVKRWGFKGGPKTHGQSDRWRHPGSIGAGTDPGRVIKGMKMGGRMGGNTVTLKNRKLVNVVNTYLLIKGALPGNNGDLVIVKSDK